MPTPYHAAYWAHALSISDATGTVADLSRSMANARVDLNPHQVDAALFAIRSPLSRGVILADEVGLGKTIEAGLVIAQKWAERKRRILLVVPATLRKQWQQELADKFAIRSAVLDGPGYQREVKAGQMRPFERPGEIVIVSYQFAAARDDDIGRVDWDLVVFDEAHRLRNVYKTDSRIAAALRDATRDRPKLLLTATPLQNSLLELYGLVSFIDPHVFGDEASFRDLFVAPASPGRDRYAQLRERLNTVCTRTLRRHVLEYVRFTDRIPITQDFTPGADEQRLYELVSEYLRRPQLAALPQSQRGLITLVLRRLLASSTFAIAATLRNLAARVEHILMTADVPGMEPTFEDLDDVDDIIEEYSPTPGNDNAPTPERAAILTELADLRSFAHLAESIEHNAKGEALLTVLGVALDKAAVLGAARKAVIFTESRRTQSYLLALLNRHGYAGQVVLMNGENTDERSREIYENWAEKHRSGTTASGSKSADTKAAIVEEFRERATVLLATEAAAEGVNLQFCSLVVNYDLPWNPQRVEQRIGRCHRYGQKHDVVVVNFLNRKNAADQRVFEILSEKFKLFAGVFGASDDVLGAVESGLDFERRIVQVYQECRTNDEINAAFDALRAELEETISARLEDTRLAVLDHFDQDVHDRLRVHREQAQAALDERQRFLWGLARFEFARDADFSTDEPRFNYRGADGSRGWYHLRWPQADDHGDAFFRPDHPLALRAIERARTRVIPASEVLFELSHGGVNIDALEPFAGASGWLVCGRLTVEALRSEEHLVLAATCDDGRRLDSDQCRKLMGLRADVSGDAPGAPASLDAARDEAIQAIIASVMQRNAEWFGEEVRKLDEWAADLRTSLERELRELDHEISAARRESLAAVELAAKLQAQKELKRLEALRSRKRGELFEAQDAIAARRDTMIADIERHMGTTHTWSEVFAIRWRVA